MNERGICHNMGLVPCSIGHGVKQGQPKKLMQSTMREREQNNTYSTL